MHGRAPWFNSATFENMTVVRRYVRTEGSQDNLPGGIPLQDLRSFEWRTRISIPYLAMDSFRPEFLEWEYRPIRRFTRGHQVQCFGRKVYLITGALVTNSPDGSTFVALVARVKIGK